MSTPHVPPEPEPRTPAPAAGSDSRTTSRWAVIIPSVALLVGLLLGGLIVGVAQSGDGFTDSPEEEASATPSATPTEDDAGTAVVVPDSCLELADSAQRATELVRGGIESIREFRPDEILELLNQLEDLDVLVREQTSTCRQARVTDAPVPE